MKPRVDAPRPTRRRRWPRVLLFLFVMFSVMLLVLAHFLQPRRLTALILRGASHQLHLTLHVKGAGRIALRPEPRLVLPGLSATLPGASAPFFHSDSVELALPWNTLRGKGSDIDSIVLKSPDIELASLRKWIATLPAGNQPFQIPRLTRGLHIDGATIRGATWTFGHLDLELPSLGERLPMHLDASADLTRGGVPSHFVLAVAGTPSAVGFGARLDGAQLALDADGELPSFSAKGALLASSTVDVDLRGVLRRMPRAWSEATDSAFAKSADAPFTLRFVRGAPDAQLGSGFEAMTARHGYRLEFALGDPKRQPALKLHFDGNSGAIIDARLNGELSRWPDAWPGLPDALAGSAMPIAFEAAYDGPALLTSAVTFDVHRADTRMQGSFKARDLLDWIGNPSSAPLPPVTAKMSAARIGVGGVVLQGVQLDIRDDADPAASPRSAPASHAP